MSSNQLLPLVQEAVQAFGLHYQASMLPVLTQYRFGGGDWLRLFFTFGLDPQPLTLHVMQSLLPFHAEARNRQPLLDASGRDLLEEVDANTFRLSETGRQAMQHFFRATGKAIGELQPVTATDLNRLANLLQRVVAAAETAVAPTAKTRLLMSRRTDPGTESAVTVHIDVVDCLNGFRDDAHIATFTVAGHVWEAFTDVWQGTENTAEAIAQKQPNRGYTTADYTTALNSLVKRSWLTESDGIYSLTDEGQTIREEAERQTDRNFYSPWAVLNLAEVQEMRDLLSQLEASLQKTAEPITA